MQAIITILTLLLTQSESLPVTSKALESNSDQLIWQTAWFSSQLHDGRDESPFTGEPKKITAKSIFITPNFNENVSHCPPGYKIDDNGKCVKVVNINQDDILKTRLQNFFSQHQTTGDTKSIDYDYSTEDESSHEPTHYTLPLAPIWNESDSSQYNVNESDTSTVQYEIELNDFSFHKTNDSSDSEFQSSAVSATYSDDIQPQQATDDQVNIERKVPKEDQTNVATERNELDENSTKMRHEEAMHVDKLLKESDSSTADTLSYFENTQMTDPIFETTSPPDTLRVATSFHDHSGDDNYPTTLSSEENLQTEKTIDDTSEATTNAIQLDDYFDTILLNDSLLIDESSSDESTTDDAETDSTTINAFALLPDATANKTLADEKTITPIKSLSPTTIENSFTVLSTQNNDVSYENRIIKDDQQIADLENVEVSNKFVYHHLPTTEKLSDKGSLATVSTAFVRFPTEVDSRASKVRFPDEKVPNSSPTTMSFTWPRDNGYQTVGVMRYWQDQPLIEDFKFFTRGNSRGPNLEFNRPQTAYRRNH